MIPIYLPIAEASIDMLLLLAIGGGIGFMSGLFGVGGGFLLTPALMFAGVPARIAVASGGNQVVGASFSALLTHWRKGNVDVRLGLALTGGGFLGSLLGVRIAARLIASGQMGPVVSIAYVVLLGTVGVLMMGEIIRSRLEGEAHDEAGEPGRFERWMARLPLRVYFPRSEMTMSLIPPVALGFFVGVLTAVMGVGGGFIIVPAMIYLLKVPGRLVVGTSLLQITLVTAASTLMHAISTQTVDILLAAILLVGGVVGAQLGAIAGAKIDGGRFRALLAALVLATAGKLLVDMMREPAPDERYDIRIERRSAEEPIPAAPAAGRSEPSAVVGLREKMEVKLFPPEAKIRTIFTGTELLIVGGVTRNRELAAHEKEPDLLIVIEGPRQDVVVRRKEKSFGVWTPGPTARISGAPHYYAVAATQPLEKITSRILSSALLINAGERAPLLWAAPDDPAEAGNDDFVDAFVAERRAKALYESDVVPIRRDGPVMFYADFKLPRSIISGRYDARIYLLRGRQLLDTAHLTINAERDRFEDLIYRGSRERRWLYGLVSVALAMALGWAAAEIFRRARR